MASKRQLFCGFLNDELSQLFDKFLNENDCELSKPSFRSYIIDASLRRLKTTFDRFPVENARNTRSSPALEYSVIQIQTSAEPECANLILGQTNWTSEDLLEANSTTADAVKRRRVSGGTNNDNCLKKQRLDISLRTNAVAVPDAVNGYTQTRVMDLADIQSGGMDFAPQLNQRRAQRVKPTKSKRPKTKGKVHSCEYCGSCYSTPSSLQRHKNTQHANEFPHICLKCNKGFLDQKKLDQHKIICNHRTFECYLCQQSTKYHSQLVVHMRKHTGVKPFPCSSCPNSFTTAYVRSQHEKKYCSLQQQKSL